MLPSNYHIVHEQWFADWIASLVPAECSGYVEVFGTYCTVFLKQEKPFLVINDINKFFTDWYFNSNYDPDEFYRQLGKLTFSQEDWNWARIVCLNPNAYSEIERCAAFWIISLNRPVNSSLSDKLNLQIENTYLDYRSPIRIIDVFGVKENVLFIHLPETFIQRDFDTRHVPSYDQDMLDAILRRLLNNKLNFILYGKAEEIHQAARDANWTVHHHPLSAVPVYSSVVI